MDKVALRGPKARGILGNTSEFRQDPLGFLTRCGQEYGDIVPLRFGTRRAYLLKSPELIEEVLVTQHKNFSKGQALRRSTFLFGNGLLTSEGDFWRRQRKLMQPAFHREHIAAYAQVMVQETLARIERWQEGATLDIHAEMTQLTLPIAVKTLFGAEMQHSERIGEIMALTQSHFERWIYYLTMLPSWAPTPVVPSLARASRELDVLVYDLIAQSRARSAQENQNNGSSAKCGDLLSMLLQAQDEDGATMTDRQLRDEVLTLFLAGHDTTALTLTWTLFLLAQHPLVVEALRAELETVLAGRTPTAADRPNLKTFERVIQESMRLYPPAWTFGRTATHPCEIGGVQITPGNTVIVSPWVMHRDPRWFSNPDRFLPERWEHDFAKSLPKYAYFPFGGGPRVCIGNTFALMEAVLVLATLLQRWHFTLLPDQNIALQAAVTLRPRYGIQMRVTTISIMRESLT